MKKSALLLFLAVFLLGLIVDRAYMVYRNQNEEDAFVKHITEAESINYNHLLNLSYGTIVISAINKNAQTASDDVDFKIGLAKMHKWSIIGGKKIDSTHGYYIVSQTAFRLVE